MSNSGKLVQVIGAVVDASFPKEGIYAINASFDGKYYPFLISDKNGWIKQTSQNMDKSNKYLSFRME